MGKGEAYWWNKAGLDVVTVNDEIPKREGKGNEMAGNGRGKALDE